MLQASISRLASPACGLAKVRWWCRLGWLVLALTCRVEAGEPSSGGGNPVEAATLTFEQHVRPILKAHCFDCHGEGESLKGGLDLRLRKFMERGGESGSALTPGNPEASLIFKLVASGEMPKRDRKPTNDEIEALRRWIAVGAPTARPEPDSLDAGMQITAEERAHWAFQPVRRPPVPRIKDARVRNPIDAFLAADQQARGLSFSPDAPDATLIRRAFLDLWGLQPTPSDLEVQALDASPDAYGRLLDRLLASPQYGERWARHWLDIAGYADSDGYTNDDTPRPYSWKFRDYVIRALNEDKPFDRFITEQLAGDELALTKHPNLDSAAQDPVARE